MHNKKLDNKKTNNYWLWMLILFTFFLMLVVFLVFGEVNLSKLNWLVAINGKKWGKINGQIEYGYGVSPDLNVSPYIFIIMVGVLILIMAIFILLMLFNKIQFNSFPFLIASWFVFFSIITTGLLYPNTKDSFQWEILVRIIVVLASYPLTFFIFNYITKKIFIKTKWGEIFINNLIENEKINAKEINKISHKNFKSKNQEPTSIEIDSKDI